MFQVEGQRVDNVLTGSEYSRRGHGLAGSLTLPRLGYQQAGAGAEGRARAAGARGAPNISSFTRAGRWLGSRAAEEQVGRRRLGRGVVRGLTIWARHDVRLGSLRRIRRCGIARGRTSFAPTDGRPRGRRYSWGRAGRRKRGGRRGTARGPNCLARHAGRLGVGTARGGAGPLADATPAPGPQADTGPSLRAGLPAGAGTEEVGGAHGGPPGTARGHTASLCPRAGWEPVPRGGKRGEGWLVVGALPFPRELQVGRGPAHRGRSAGAGHGQLGAIAWRRLASGGPGGLAARERAGGLVWTAGREKAKEGRR